MSYTYAQRKKAAPRADAPLSAAPERMDALARGAVKPSAAELGRRADLPDAMRARMESSFGDVSALRESQTADSSLAGRERAAGGTDAYGGASAPLSAASAAPAAGPMQAKRKKDKDAARAKADMDMMHRSSTEEAAEQYEDEVRESGMGDTIEKMMLMHSIQSSRDKHRENGEDPGEGGFSDEDIEWYNGMTDDKSDAVNVVSAMQKMYTAKRLRAHAAWEKLSGHNAKEEDVVKLAFGDDATDASTYEEFMRRYCMDIGDYQLEDQVQDSLKKLHSGVSPEIKKKLDEYNDFTQTAWNSKLVKGNNGSATPLGKKLEAAQDKRHQKLYDEKYDAENSKKWYEFWK